MPASEVMDIKDLKPVFTQEQIATRVRELASEIDGVYGDEPLAQLFFSVI